MAALLDILHSLRLTGGVFLDAEFSAPWCVTAKVGPEDCRPFLPQPHSIVAYHYVTAGRLVVGLKGEPPMEVKAGEIVVLPRNDEHRLGSALSVRAVNADRLIQPATAGGLPRIVHGGGGQATRIVCGFLGGDSDCEPITRILPRLMKVSVAGAASGKWIESSIRYAVEQLSDRNMAVVAKLAELLFLEAVRHHLASAPPGEAAWTVGLRDPLVARALGLLHGRTYHHWTAEELAREVGLSRSALAQRFTATLGMPPIEYLTRVRLQGAARRLSGSREPVARIAFAAGYESEAAFNRAFKRAFGLAPGAWRKREKFQSLR